AAFFTDTPTSSTAPPSLHDALPIYCCFGLDSDSLLIHETFQRVRRFVQLAGAVGDIPRLTEVAHGSVALVPQGGGSLIRPVERRLQKLQSARGIGLVERFHEVADGHAALIRTVDDLFESGFRRFPELEPLGLIRNLGGEFLEAVTE